MNPFNELYRVGLNAGGAAAYEGLSQLGEDVAWEGKTGYNYTSPDYHNGEPTQYPGYEFERHDGTGFSWDNHNPYNLPLYEEEEKPTSILDMLSNDINVMNVEKNMYNPEWVGGSSGSNYYDERLPSAHNNPSVSDYNSGY